MVCVGKLGKAVREAPSRMGTHHRLPEVLEALPEDARNDLRALFDDPRINVAEIRRQVMALFPDAPKHPESTWFYWAREWRNEGRRF